MRTIYITSNHIAVFLKSFHYIDFLFLTNVPGLYFISFLSQGSWPKNACPFAEINVKINNVDLSITNSSIWYNWRDAQSYNKNSGCQMFPWKIDTLYNHGRGIFFIKSYFNATLLGNTRTM